MHLPSALDLRYPLALPLVPVNPDKGRRELASRPSLRHQRLRCLRRRLNLGRILRSESRGLFCRRKVETPEYAFAASPAVGLVAPQPPRQRVNRPCRRLLVAERAQVLHLPLDEDLPPPPAT
eukprot:COSAG04_NODE_6284_length_1365_cov_68.557662_2_plen_122_part_00